ncbi:MAG: OmpA family protein [Kiritimatiellae bacterium]|nr:OmpA family protein [Kiritimatiellia bacterium]
MKSSTIMAIALCGVLACAVTGCKYDDDASVPDDEDIAKSTDINTDGDALPTDGVTDGKDVATADGTDGTGGAGAGANANAAGTDMSGIQDENGTPATGLPFDQDPNFVRCTDVAFEPVYFGFDASNLQQSEMAKIEAVAAHLKQTGRVVIVEGNCDERGSNEYNLSLGEIRAIAIRDYLVTLGVDPTKIQTKSYGEEKPAVVGHEEGAWSKNRRGEFAVFAHK